MNSRCAPLRERQKQNELLYRQHSSPTASTALPQMSPSFIRYRFRYVSLIVVPPSAADFAEIGDRIDRLIVTIGLVPAPNWTYASTTPATAGRIKPTGHLVRHKKGPNYSGGCSRIKFSASNFRRTMEQANDVCSLGHRGHRHVAFFDPIRPEQTCHC